MGLTIVTSGGAFVCSGSLISVGWVLSAAHCTVTANAQYNMRFGSIQFSTGGLVQVATELINHPAYNATNLNNDVSLLRIPSPLTVSDAIQPIRLPTAAQLSDSFAGQLVTVSGWGSVTQGGDVQATLRWVSVRVIANDVCVQSYPAATIIDSVICTVGDINQGTCGGDSGSPLVLLEDGVPTLIGSVSFGAPAARGGCNGTLPSGYMRTANQLTWIGQVTGLRTRK